MGADRVRLWLERARDGYRIRDAATEELVRGDDPRIRVVKVAGVSFRLDASVEVLDIRTLKPLDEGSLLASAAKTGRVVIVQEAPRTCGFAAELAAILAEKSILDLQAPVVRVTGYDVPYPYWQIEDAYMPSVARVVDAARRVLDF